MKKKEKERRKAILRDIRKKEEQQAFAKKPISNENLKALFDHLSHCLAGKQDGKEVILCDHTLNKSRAFLKSRGVENIEEICEWFSKYGGFCDCEVIFNVTDYWEERIS